MLDEKSINTVRKIFPDTIGAIIIGWKPMANRKLKLLGEKIPNLMEYANVLRMQKRVKELIGVWL